MISTRTVHIIDATPSSKKELSYYKTFTSSSVKEANFDLLELKNGIFVRASEASFTDPRDDWSFQGFGFADDVSSYALSETSDFVTSWVNGATVTTADTDAAPDGTVTADTLTDDDAGTTETINRTVSLSGNGARLRLQVYIKKDAVETRFPEIGVDQGGTLFRVQINTTTGDYVERTSTAQNRTVGVEEVGNYWLLSMTCDATSTATSAIIRFYPALTTVIGSVQTSATGSITVAQASLAEFNHNAWLNIDVPRIFSDGQILVEDSRTNPVLFSNDFNDASWINYSGWTRTPNVAPGPDGSENLADRLTVAAGGTRQFRTEISGVANDAFVSIATYLRCESGTYPIALQIRERDGSANNSEFFTVTEEWQRFLHSGSVGSGSSELEVGFVDSAGAGGSMLAYNYQAEIANFISSPIRSTGSAVTRAVDLMVFSGSLIDQRILTEGFEIDYYPKHDSGSTFHTTEYIIGFQSAASVYIRMGGQTATESRLFFRNGGSLVGATNISYVAGDKITVRVEFGNTMSIFVNGVLQGTSDDISAQGDWSVRSADKLIIGAGPSGASAAFGVLSRLRAL